MRARKHRPPQRRPPKLRQPPQRHRNLRRRIAETKIYTTTITKQRRRLQLQRPHAHLHEHHPPTRPIPPPQPIPLPRPPPPRHLLLDRPLPPRPLLHPRLRRGRPPLPNRLDRPAQLSQLILQSLRWEECPLPRGGLVIAGQFGGVRRGREPDLRFELRLFGQVGGEGGRFHLDFFERVYRRELGGYSRGGMVREVDVAADGGVSLWGGHVGVAGGFGRGFGVGGRRGGGGSRRSERV
mmetsp:Transcript_31688/g.66306  ORF Transcript_31688/g.66306 Transcript_31688/m.66306 type:complete len:238 (-) Transcript_31688:1620-2333(-)